jgi:hypothetical protein
VCCGLVQWRRFAEFAGDVVVVAVAEAESDVVADVDLVRAVDAVDQAGLFERGLGAGPAGLCPQAGVGVGLPGGERGEQDAGLVGVEDGGAGGVAQGAALRLGEEVQARCDGPGFGRDAPQRQRAAEVGMVLGGGDGGRGTRQLASQAAGELVGGERDPGGGERGQRGERVGELVLASAGVAGGLAACDSSGSSSGTRSAGWLSRRRAISMRTCTGRSRSGGCGPLTWWGWMPSRFASLSGSSPNLGDCGTPLPGAGTYPTRTAQLRAETGRRPAASGPRPARAAPELGATTSQVVLAWLQQPPILRSPAPARLRS